MLAHDLVRQARLELDEALGALEEADCLDDEPTERQEALEIAGVAAIKALASVLDLTTVLRGEGAPLDPMPRGDEAILTVMVNFHRVAAEAIANVEMVAERIRG